MGLFTSEHVYFAGGVKLFAVVHIASGYALSHTVDGLLPQMQYKFRLRAGNSMGYSQWSPTITVATTGTQYSLIQ